MAAAARYEADAVIGTSWHRLWHFPLVEQDGTSPGQGSQLTSSDPSPCSCRVARPRGHEGSLNQHAFVLFWSHLHPNSKGLRNPLAQMPTCNTSTRGAKGERPSQLWLSATTEGSVPFAMLPGNGRQIF